MVVPEKNVACVCVFSYLQFGPVLVDLLKLLY